MKYDNIFYFDKLNDIGGVEQFFYYLSKTNCEKDITIFYSEGNDKQIERLKKYVRVLKHKGEFIECNKAYWNYQPKIIDYVVSNENIQIHHTNYNNKKPHIHTKINRHIAVSQVVADSLYDHTGIKAKVIYNPLEIDKPKKVLKLISTTRLAGEKRKSNYEKFAKILDESGIPYLWLIFTTDKNAIQSDNVVYMKPRLDISSFIKEADYLVQLSDEDVEGYSYTINEALSLNTPIISTRQAVYEELGINDKCGFIIDINNIPVNEIYKKKFKIDYKDPISTWGEELGGSKSTYLELKKKKYLVKANDTCKLGNVYDKERKCYIKPNEEWEIDGARLEEIKRRVDVIKCIN